MANIPLESTNDQLQARRQQPQTIGFDVRVLERALAPSPLVDRYPVVVGQGVSLSYLAQIFRLCLTGFRREYVDLLDELLEKDPHAYAVTSKRVETVACAKLELAPPEDLEDSERERAEEYAGFASRKIKAIPDLTKALASLAWGEFYGASAAETEWDRDAKGWSPVALNFIHSRRISYPNASEWAAHIWDLGPVWGQTSAYGPVQSAGTWSPTQGMFGLRIDDYPGKFVLHTPQLRGDYPTREGIGRQIATWILLKLIAGRGASQYLERFAKPWVEGIYSTKNKSNEFKGREAAKDDKDVLDVIMAALGAGSSQRGTHADSVEIKFVTPDGGNGTAKITFAEWIAICDSQMSKAVLSSTLTTEVGVTGSRAVAQTQQKGEDKRYVFSAQMLADSLRRCLVFPLIRLNFGGDVPLHLMPRVLLRTGEEPDPSALIKNATDLADRGAPVDADAIADETGVALIKNDTPDQPRRLFPVLPAKYSPPPEIVGLPEESTPPPPAPIVAPGQPTKPGEEGAKQPPPPPKKPAAPAAE